MNARGVIIEATASFKITWSVSGPGRDIKWDQNNQYIELHDSDVYPDLEYYEASARATYVKYASAARLNDLLKAIGAKIDSALAKITEAEEQSALPPGPPDPKQLPQSTGNTTSALLPVPNSSNNLPAVIEPGVTPDAPKQPEKTAYDYTVTVYAPKLKFIEGQRNSTTASAEILFKVSNNLNPELAVDGVDNTGKIYTEVAYSTTAGLVKTNLKFEIFEEEVTKFGGNLLAQVIPSLELKFKAKEDVYAYNDEDSGEVKVTKAVRGDLEKLPEDKLKEIEDMILRIRNDRTAKKAREIDAIQQASDK